MSAPTDARGGDAGLFPGPSALGAVERSQELRRSDGRSGTAEELKRLAEVEAASEPPHLRYITADKLEDLKIPPRSVILRPWWGDGEWAILWGWRGSGKTWIALGVAAALAAGGEIFGWKAARPLRVVFIDGEMMKRRLQARLRVLRSVGLNPGENLALLTPDEMGRLLNLWNQKDRDEVERVIEKFRAEVVVFDNAASLYHPANNKSDPNSAEWWEAFQTWAIDLRRRGIATLIVVHTGKEGTGPRGTSAIEDLPEWSIKVEEAKGHTAKDPAWFTVQFTKTREFLGDDGEAFEVRLEAEAWSVSSVGHGAKEAEVLETIRANPGLSSGKEVLKKYRDGGGEIKAKTFWAVFKTLQNTGKVHAADGRLSVPDRGNR